jgi:hypothetical protein
MSWPVFSKFKIHLYHRRIAGGVRRSEAIGMVCSSQLVSRVLMLILSVSGIYQHAWQDINSA